MTSKIPFQIDGITTEEFSYSQLKARSLRYAECLLAEGVGEGDAVGLCSENRIDFTCVLFGSMYLGATVAPLNLTYSESKPLLSNTPAYRIRTGHRVVVGGGGSVLH